jgi:uncharacterized protein YlxW (UPF0749 family)
MIAAILLRLAPYKLAFEIAIFGALAAGVLYGAHQFLEHERDIGRNEVRAEYAKQLAEAKDAARQREQQLQSQVNEANQHAQERDQTIQALAARAGVSTSGLRDTIAAIGNSMSGATADALRNTARAYGEVLAECATRRGELAVTAEKFNSEKRTLIEAWPQNPPAGK